jgi:hypothetical protein
MEGCRFTNVKLRTKGNSEQIVPLNDEPEINLTLITTVHMLHMDNGTSSWCKNYLIFT